MYMGMIGALPRYNTMKCQLLSMNIGLEMLGTYPIAGKHETVRY